MPKHKMANKNLRHGHFLSNFSVKFSKLNP